MTSNITVDIGQIAPLFNLPCTGLNQDSCSMFDLSKYQGKKVVLYFYPKDNTSGCTTQAETFRDVIDDFTTHNTVVVGISPDSMKSHANFMEKYKLNFPLVSDEEKVACTLYGVWVEKSMYGKKYMGVERSTFVIDEHGKINQIWRKVKVPGHVQAVLAHIKTL